MSESDKGGRVRLGANPGREGAWEFVVWAPKSEGLSLHVCAPSERSIAMTKDDCGYHRAVVSDLEQHSRYLYRFSDGREHADPASRYQPEGVHAPSETVDLIGFPWTDATWTAPKLEDTVFYEVHIGTYSREGTLDRMGEDLPALAALGVTTIELMPVAQFPGSRNWGYDGVYPFAVQNTYGGPLALQRFVNRAHAHGLAVALDVVYNHLGPEGNYLPQFGPYFSDKYRTPWGAAINFDGPLSDPVRRFFIENALFWFEQFHIDVLRLDAIHGIFDFGALHVLAELEKEVELAAQQMGRRPCLVAESDLNDAKVLWPAERGGYGLAAQWSDDFHHSLHTLLTGENEGYYADFGTLNHLATVLREKWFYRGNYSRYRHRRHGNSPRGTRYSSFVVSSQNHDQIGNRAKGDRLSTIVSFEAQKLAAGMTLLSPFVPLLFMGQEYGEPNPFPYFTSHGDEGLIEAVRRGRREEFSEFGWKGEIFDPHDEATFTSAILQQHLREREPYRTLQLFYQELMRLRRAYHLGAEAEWEVIEFENLNTLTLFRRAPEPRLLMLFNFDRSEVVLASDLPTAHWVTELNSADTQWRGPGSRIARTVGPTDAITLSGQAFIILRREKGE